MNTEGPANTDSDEMDDCRPTVPAGRCDPSSAIDERKCRDVGLSAQLAYSAEHDQQLQDAKSSYDLARIGYREKRHDAALAVQVMKHDVKHLIERIKCLIGQDHVTSHLDAAFAQVCRQLDCCEGEGGCCVPETDFKVPLEGQHDGKKLASRIERYKAVIAKTQECFDTLAGEPAALEARVAAVRASLDEIPNALRADGVDLKKQYATALIANRKLTRVWNGFDNTTEYVDCLCQALTTWSKGVDAVSQLVGMEAVRKCTRESADAWCTTLLTGEGPVAEVLSVYDRLCAAEKSRVTETPEPPLEKHSEDCGCGGHHHTEESTTQHPASA